MQSYWVMRNQLLSLFNGLFAEILVGIEAVLATTSTEMKLVLLEIRTMEHFS